MSDYFSSVSWGSIASNVMPYYSAGVFQLNKYLVEVTPIDINEPGADDLTAIAGDYFIDFLGYPYEIESVTSITGGLRFRVVDLNSRSLSELVHYSPYPNRIGYVYRPTKDGIILSQSQLLKLDAQARDRINNIEKGVIWENRGISIDDGGNITDNITRMQLGNNLSTTGSPTSDDWNGGTPFLLDVVVDGDDDCFLLKSVNGGIANSGYTFSTNNTLSDATDDLISSTLAIKTYIDNMSSGGNFLDSVIRMVVNNSFDPNPKTSGDRYITETTSLHANFGTITGLGVHDIVEYNGATFTIVFDASAAATPATVTVGIDSNGNANHQWTYNISDDVWVDRGAVVNHDDTGNIGIAGSGVSYGHIDLNAQTLYGLKSFNDGLGTIGTSKISFNNSPTNYYLQYADTTYGIKGNSLYGWSLYSNGSLSFRINPAGNIGLGTTDVESWSAYKAIEGAGSSMAFSTVANYIQLSSNAYYDGVWKYKNTNLASNYVSVNGTHRFRYATSGTIDTAITWLDSLYLDSNGNVGINTITPSYLLHVKQDQNAGTRLMVDNSTNNTGAFAVIDIKSQSQNLRAYSFSPNYTTAYRASRDEINSTAANGLQIVNANYIRFQNTLGTDVLTIYGEIANFTTATTGITASLSDNSTKYATTAWVKGQGYTSGTGTVTSVAMTVPTGLSISGTPIATSGTLALSLTAGYSIPTTANQANWSSAYTFTSGFVTNYPDLTAIEALSGTSGFLKKTSANTWALDTNSYLTTNQTITLSGDVSGSGTTSIAVTVSNDSHLHTGSTVSGLTNANLSGSAGISNANLANSSITVNGTSISLGSSETITSNTTNILRFNDGGAGSVSGATFNGSETKTISYNTIGAYPSTNPNNYIARTGISSSATGLTYTSSTGVFSLTSGYSIPTTAKQSTWDSALYSTNIYAGNGLYFSDITNGIGEVAMGTPASISPTSTNSFGSNGSHTHAYTPASFSSKAGSGNFSWGVQATPNIYTTLSNSITITMSELITGRSGICYITVDGTPRTITLTTTGFTKKIDSGASVSGSNLSLDANSVYALTFVVITSSIIVFNIAKYNTL